MEPAETTVRARVVECRDIHKVIRARTRNRNTWIMTRQSRAGSEAGEWNGFREQEQDLVESKVSNFSRIKNKTSKKLVFSSYSPQVRRIRDLPQVCTGRAQLSAPAPDSDT
ncbi:hypothetical protein NQD34_013062 [Periophthalmus magnuspinnatus]|nr:hypothetical protein NQD34_013062 [Periophthalmus magnuspinnatus]